MTMGTAMTGTMMTDTVIMSVHNPGVTGLTLRVPVSRNHHETLNLQSVPFVADFLNMGDYTIRLTPAAQKICMIITPWEKYSYQ